MSNIRKVSIFLVVGLAQLETKAQQDALDEFAAKNRVLEAQDPSTPIRPIPDKYSDVSTVEKLSESDFAKMRPDQLQLKIAWVDLILNIQGRFPDRFVVAPRESKESEYRIAIYSDLIRRGDAAMPAVLALADELQDTIFESRLLSVIDSLPTVKIQPAVEYCRRLLRTRPRSSLIEDAATLLSRHGDSSDVNLLEQIARDRPFFSETIRNRAKSLRKHLIANQRANFLNAKKDPAPTNTPPLVQPPAPKKVPEAKPALTPSEETTSSTPWSIIVVLIVAAIGLLWLLLKRRS
jgi:hypothetical protein